MHSDFSLKADRKTHTDKKTRRTSSGPPMAQSSPQERKPIPLQPRSKGVASLLSHRGQIACSLRWVSCLWVCGLPSGRWCLMNLLVLRLYRLAYQRVPLVEKCLPPDSIPCQPANSRRRWFVLSPMPPCAGDTTVRVFHYPCQPMVI